MRQPTYPPTMIQAMRDWAADCEWLDGEAIDTYTDAQILRGIDRHYADGIAGFVRDSQDYWTA